MEKLGRRDGTETPAEEYRRLRLATLAIEREQVLEIRSSGTVDHDVIEEVLAALDVEESMLTISAQRAEELEEGQTVATPHTPRGLRPSRLRALRETTRRPGGVRGLHPRVHVPSICASVSAARLRRVAILHRPARDPALPQQPPHPVMRSFEPGESWRWCFLDERIG